MHRNVNSNLFCSNADSKPADSMKTEVNVVHTERICAHAHVLFEQARKKNREKNKKTIYGLNYHWTWI